MRITAKRNKTKTKNKQQTKILQKKNNIKMTFNNSRPSHQFDLDALPESQWKPYFVVTVTMLTLIIMVFGHVKKIVQTVERKTKKKNRKINVVEIQSV